MRAGQETCFWCKTPSPIRESLCYHWWCQLLSLLSISVHHLPLPQAKFSLQDQEKRDGASRCHIHSWTGATALVISLRWAASNLLIGTELAKSLCMNKFPFSDSSFPFWIALGCRCFSCPRLPMSKLLITNSVAPHSRIGVNYWSCSSRSLYNQQEEIDTIWRLVVYM